MVPEYTDKEIEAMSQKARQLTRTNPTPGNLIPTHASLQDQINDLTALLEHALCFMGETLERATLLLQLQGWDQTLLADSREYNRQREACIALIRATLA